MIPMNHDFCLLLLLSHLGHLMAQLVSIMALRRISWTPWAFFAAAPSANMCQRAAARAGGTAMVSTQKGWWAQIIWDFPYDDHLSGGYLGLFVVRIDKGSKMKRFLALPQLGCRTFQWLVCAHVGTAGFETSGRKGDPFEANQVAPRLVSNTSNWLIALTYELTELSGAPVGW